MPSKSLTVASLQLDLLNPRITKASTQREALQRIIEDQDVKLAVLAESIATDGLNPMDRWLVLKSGNTSKYVVYEGNRRLAALKILNNPAVLSDLEVRPATRKRLESIAATFDPSKLKHIDCFEISSREEGAIWLHQRHTGANKGRGIVDWNGLATARFRGNDPALQALDVVLKFGQIAPGEKDDIEDKFPITTLDRLLSTPAVRAKLGLEIKSGKLLTDLPPAEALKSLKRIVLDLATGAVNVTKVKLKAQQVEYVEGLGVDLPDLSKKTGQVAPVDGWEEADFAPPKPGGGSARGAAAKARPPVATGRSTPKRRVLITKDCALFISNPKVQEIERELRTLPLADYRHSIAVLFRVFFEITTDVYLSKQGVALTYDTTNGKKDKSLKTKVQDALTALKQEGTPDKALKGVSNGIHDHKNALYIETLHNYVHNQFYSPKESDLTTAFDNARPYFEAIWK